MGRSMNWNEKLFNYCERGADPGFWAEPANALTNLAFALVAFMVGRYLLARGVSPRTAPWQWGLAGLVALIAIGSFGFHTLATRAAQLGDLVPIGLFMLTYLAFALRHLLGLSALPTMLVLAGFIAAIGLAGSITCAGDVPCLNGSLGYLPALVGLLVVGTVLLRKGDPPARLLLWGGAVFGLSIVLRSIDRMVCAIASLHGYAVGTHFLWHCLNALTLYILLLVAISRIGTDHQKSSPERY